VKALYHRRIVPAWLALANAVGAFLEEVCFRLVLAFNVLADKTPIKAKRRWWNRAIATPVLVDVFDWTDERLIFSVLVWPPLEAESFEAYARHEERVEEVLRVLHAGAAQMARSPRYEIDNSLRWDHERECWVDGDGHAYDAARLYDYSRQEGEGVRSYWPDVAQQSGMESPVRA
jgi:hypothetical protein